MAAPPAASAASEFTYRAYIAASPDVRQNMEEAMLREMREAASATPDPTRAEYDAAPPEIQEMMREAARKKRMAAMPPPPPRAPPFVAPLVPRSTTNTIGTPQVTIITGMTYHEHKEYAGSRAKGSDFQYSEAVRLCGSDKKQVDEYALRVKKLFDDNTAIPANHPVLERASCDFPSYDWHTWLLSALVTAGHLSYVQIEHPFRAMYYSRADALMQLVKSPDGKFHRCFAL
jgi:hypothetical protein